MLDQRFQKFVVRFNKTIDFKLTHVKHILGHDAENIQYIGIYGLEHITYLYIQRKSTFPMYKSKIKFYMNRLGNFEGPFLFDILEGDCIEFEGSIKTRGREKGSKVKDGNVIKPQTKIVKKAVETAAVVNPKTKKLKVPVVNEEQDRLLPTPKKLKVAAPMRFFPVYTGYNRKWEIVSWFPETESIRRNTSSFRDILLEKQDHKCNYCDCIVNFGEYSNADVDHKIPLNCGGGSYIDNLQVLCVMCHRYKTALETKSRTMTKTIEEMGLE